MELKLGVLFLSLPISSRTEPTNMTENMEFHDSFGGSGKKKIRLLLRSRSLELPLTAFPLLITSFAFFLPLISNSRYFEQRGRFESTINLQGVFANQFHLWSGFFNFRRLLLYTRGSLFILSS